MLSASLIQLEYVPKQWKSTFSYSNYDIFWEANNGLIVGYFATNNGVKLIILMLRNQNILLFILFCSQLNIIIVVVVHQKKKSGAPTTIAAHQENRP